jgi:tRNA modification GTPase
VVPGCNDTIVAVSTPAGRSARAILRLSGPKALGIAAGLFLPDPRPLESFRALDGQLTAGRIAGVPARLYLMRAPRSYTRQDVVELHVPGSPVLAELVLEAAMAAGARLAEPGEFTRRALANGRISPEQAEAVINVIRARSRAELVAAAGSLAGHAGRELAAWRAQAEDLAARMEAELDYGERPAEFLDDARAAAELARLGAELDALLERERSGMSGPASGSGRVRSALAGPVNAGKSLLFRRLTGRAALVSPRPGTTRDVLEAELAAAPADLAILDTAGAGAPAGEVEHLARAAAERAWRSADLLLLVVDRSAPLANTTVIGHRCTRITTDEGNGSKNSLAYIVEIAREMEIPIVWVLNKCDLPAAFDAQDLRRSLGTGSREPGTVVEVSALTGAGCFELEHLLVKMVRTGRVERSAGGLSGSLRRWEVLIRARAGLRQASAALADGLGLACAADDLREAVRLVARQFQPGAGASELDESVLDRIFARFCVGK